MKDFVGEKIDEAMATLLKDYGIDESQVTQTSVPSDSYPAGTIIKQSPKKVLVLIPKGVKKLPLKFQVENKLKFRIINRTVNI